MVRERGLDLHPVANIGLADHLHEIELRRHVPQVHGEVARAHEAAKHLLEAVAHAVRPMDAETVAFQVRRDKKRETLNVVPVRMRYENVALDRSSLRLR